MLLFYRDRAFPREEERDIFREHYGRVRVADIEVDYNIAKDIDREGKHARELLFVSSRPRHAPPIRGGEPVWPQPTARRPVYSIGMISTRRFNARPAAVALGLIGSLSPLDSRCMRPASIPFDIR